MASKLGTFLYPRTSLGLGLEGATLAAPSSSLAMFKRSRCSAVSSWPGAGSLASAARESLDRAGEISRVEGGLTATESVSDAGAAFMEVEEERARREVARRGRVVDMVAAAAPELADIRAASWSREGSLDFRLASGAGTAAGADGVDIERDEWSTLKLRSTVR